MSVPVAVSASCPLCGCSLRPRRRRDNDEPFMSCSGFPSCRWTGPANAVEMELGRKLLEAQEALAQARAESGSVTWRDIRALLAWAHPDRHPGGVNAHELAVRISDLMHRARQSEAA